MGHYLHDRGPDNIPVCFKPDTVMSATDKNGVELKVGDKVDLFGCREIFTIKKFEINDPLFPICCTSNWDEKEHRLRAGKFVKVDSELEPARTYTEAEIREAYYACEYSEGEVIDEMLELLNATKP